ncbi:hypothetical protein J1N35_043030 [Gossypium stocksii]|uniref:Uncharacterized protein n=1 Tax=Gossypium stocksii TaxID=47602 RepID=A0A9D3U6L2_9ROSI|nr:hypothetical protein J1N35_043030 [Gossypium stocksii]
MTIVERLYLDNDRLGSIVYGVEAKRGKESKKKLVKCFLCNSPHRRQDCPKRSKLLMINKEFEEEPEEERLSKLRSIILSFTKAMRNRKQKRLMFANINIAGQMRSALVDTRASDLFISEKVMGKLGPSVSKPAKKIKTVNSKEVPNLRVVQGVEIQIDQ